MTTKNVSTEKAWGIIGDALSKYYIAVPTDYSTVYTELSDIPKEIKGVILFKEYSNMFMIEFLENGEVSMTSGDPRSATGEMKAFYELRNDIISGEYTSPNGKATSYQDHEYIDLGLSSGLKWAKTDVGRYAWAETNGKESFSKSNARKRTKFADVKGDAKMDAARVHWGGKWRTPTPEEFQELVENCTWQWRGRGYLLTGPNGKQLYLPACGYNYSAWGPLNRGTEGYYWTSLSKEGEDNATCLFFNKSERKLEWKESYMGMCVRPVFSDAETEPVITPQDAVAENPDEYTKGIVRENGVLQDKYIFEGYRNWSTGNRVSAQRKINTGDIVRITFLGVKEEKIRVNEWNGVWEMDETISVMGENYYFEVVVNEKRSYYGKYATYRYTKDSDTMGGGARITVTRTCINEAEVRKAFASFQQWLSEGGKENNYWHGLYKKTEFPEEITYGMPGEEHVTPPTEKTWNVGEIIDEGDGRFSVDGIRYELYDDYEYKDNKRVNFKALRILPLKGPDKYSGTIDIPSKVKYRSRWREVMEIGSATFCDCPELIELRLPESITSFHQIWGSPKLARVIVAEGNAKYASVDGVVYNKEMTEMVCYPHAHGRTYHVPDTITSIWGFAGCTMLEEIVIPETVKRIGSRNDNSRLGVFEGCVNLKSIHIPGSIDWIWDDTFKGCTGLEKVSFGEGTKEIRRCAFDGCTSLKEIVFPDTMEIVHWNAFYGCENVEHIVFPKGRFFNLRDIPTKLLPWGQEPFEIDGVVYTPNFDYNRLDVQVAIYSPTKDAPALTQHPEVEVLHIPATVEQYGYIYEVRECKCAFEQFPNLRSLHLPSTICAINLHRIGSLQEVVVDGDNPMYASVEGLLYSKDMTELIAAPSKWSVKKLILPDGVEVIGDDFFAGHQELEEVVFPSSVKKVGSNAFSDCLSLKTVQLNEGLERFESYAFGNTVLERVKLPLSLKYIGQKRFSGRRPFSCCSKLTAFEMDGENEWFKVVDGVLYAKQNSELHLLYCPSGRSVLHIPDGVKYIAHNACSGCNNLEEVVLSDSVIRIDDWAFYDCKNLKHVVLSKNVEYIGSCAFRECTALKELDLTVCVSRYCPHVDDNAFEYCPDMVLKLPRSLEDKRSTFEKEMKGLNQVTAEYLDATDWL